MRKKTGGRRSRQSARENKLRKSITVTGAPGAAIVRNVAGDSITISAGAADVVTITGLIVNGMNAALPRPATHLPINASDMCA